MDSLNGLFSDEENKLLNDLTFADGDMAIAADKELDDMLENMKLLVERRRKTDKKNGMIPDWQLTARA